MKISVFILSKDGKVLGFNIKNAKIQGNEKRKATIGRLLNLF
jgi:hypothetical protein